MSAPAILVSFSEPWSLLYGDSTAIQILVVFGHIAGLVFAGGLAVTLDRATLRASRGSSEMRWRQLEELRAAHRLVLVGISLSLVTGLLLFASDLETYFGSWIFWVKLGLIGALLLNGFQMTRLESRIGDTPNAADDRSWRALSVTASVSIFLWFAIAFAGVALVNAA